VTQKELRIPARPTNGKQPFPPELDGHNPNFLAMDVRHYGYLCGVSKSGRQTAEHSRNLRILTLDYAKGLVTLSIEDGYTPFCMAGNDLYYEIDIWNRTYEVTLGDHDWFDEEEYLELDEDDRTVAIIGFQHAIDFDQLSEVQP
jgi:hypothetical protein